MSRADSQRPGGFDRSDRRQLGVLASAVGALHLLGWGLFAAYASRSGNLAYAGAGTLAYTLGLRHAFDADHISAIDDTARLLIQRGRRPLGIGFFFSLGHASVVLALSVAVALGAQSVQAHVESLRRVGSVLGASVSGGFLVLVAGLNVLVLADLIRAARTDAVTDARGQGPLSRVFGARWLRLIRHERQMYWVGMLFGLGFDTASEIGLLGLTASSATRGGLPPAAILALPLIFAAGMTLLDTGDGVLMVRAYGWALLEPRRKLHYNLVTTALSVAVALGVGLLELAGVLASALGLQGRAIEALAAANDRLEALGALIVLLFAAIWVAALLAIRRGPEGETARAA